MNNDMAILATLKGGALVCLGRANAYMVTALWITVILAGSIPQGEIKPLWIIL